MTNDRLTTQRRGRSKRRPRWAIQQALDEKEANGWDYMTYLARLKELCGE